MYKVVIVDDDILIRKGIRNVIKWRDYCCDVCAEASSGEEAIEIIKECKPDIVITDIKMPNMDGIELIREIKQIIPKCKIIILTAYREFDYAQKAIRYGAFDFLLKPTKVEDLINVIQKAIMEIENERNLVETFERINKFLEEKLPILRENLLFNIIFGMITSEQEILQMAASYKVDIKNFLMVLAECNINLESRADFDNKHIYILGISNMLNDFIYKDCSVYTIYLNNTQAVYIISFDKPITKDKEKELYQDLEQLREAAKNCFNINLTLAVSTWGNGIIELPVKFKECIDAINYKFYFDEEDIIYYKDLIHLFVYNDDRELARLKSEIISNVRYGNLSNLENLLNQLEEILRRVKLDKHYIQNYYYLLLTEINMIKSQLLTRLADNNGNQSEELETGSIRDILKCKSIGELNNLLRASIYKTIEEIQKHNLNNMGALIKKAIEYIRTNYNKELSLSEISERLYISPSYLSRLFKKQTGKNLSDFINEYRIEKAKELLKESDLKTYEIAEKVGIPDPHYFSRLFKRWTGYSPSEYKEATKLNLPN